MRETRQFVVRWGETPHERRTMLRGRYERAMDAPEFYTPRFQTQFWSDMFANDPSIVVPECTWSADEMKRPMMDVRGNEVKPMLVLVPNGFVGKEGLARVDLRYPWLRNINVREGTPVKDRHTKVGYVKVEATHDAPNLDTTGRDVLRFLDTKTHPENANVQEQRLITNVIFGEALYALTGEYPDLRTVSRLPGSANEDWVVVAHRGSDGTIGHWLVPPSYHGRKLGFRLEEAKSA